VLAGARLRPERFLHQSPKKAKNSFPKIYFICFNKGMPRISLGLFCTAIVFFSGCGGFFEKFSRSSGNTTNVHLELNGTPRSQSTVINGGLMLYALQAAGAGTAKAIHFSSEQLANGAAPLVLPNGHYRFAAVGFTESEMGGEAKCGLSSPEVLHLQGGNLTVSLSLSNAGCAQEFFSASPQASTPSFGLKPVQLTSCDSTIDLSSFTASSTCTAAAGSLSSLQSLRVQLPGYDSSTGVPTSPNADFLPGPTSGCIRGDGAPFALPLFTQANTYPGPIHALTDDILLFGYESAAGLFRSTDGGATVTNVLSGVNVFAITGDQDRLFAGTQSGLYTSTDGGVNWSFHTSGDFRSVTKRGNKVIATPTGGTNNARISVDGGDTFSTYTIHSGNYVAAILTTFIDENGVIYVGGANGSLESRVLYTADDGVTWDVLRQDPSGTRADSFSIHGGAMYIGMASSGLHVSTDSGATWTTYCQTGCVNSGTLPDNKVGDVIVKDGVLYVATGSGIAISLDNRQTWEFFTTDSYSGSVWRFGSSHGRILFSIYLADGFRAISGPGSGAPFPGTGTPLVPSGGTSTLHPFVTRLTTYSDPHCQVPQRLYHFPRGLAQSPVPAGTATLRIGAPPETRLFLKDF
jgi:hypothetical protein